MKTALINMLGCSAESVVARFSENKPVVVVSLIPHSMKNTADPNPTRCDSTSRGCDP